MASTWYRIDNVSKVFIASRNRRDPRVIRLSCTLTEEIDPGALQQAAELAAAEMPSFQMSLHRGLFWPYLATCRKGIKVLPETLPPCSAVYTGDSRELLYRITYFRRRINLEIFHVLTDGTGAMEYLYRILGHYLKLKHPEISLPTAASSSAADRAEDSFRNFYGQKPALKTPNPRAFHVKGGKLPFKQTRFYEVHLPAGEVLKLAREAEVSLTSYLGALLMLSIYQEMPARDRKKRIAISLPVNLRNYYPSATSRNFFNSVLVSRVMSGEESLKEIAEDFSRQLKEKTAPEAIHVQMDSFQRWEENKLIAIAPLWLKNLVVRGFTKREMSAVSATLSSMGRLTPPEELLPYLERFSAFSSTQQIFLTVFSFRDDLTLSFSYAFNNPNVLRNFVTALTGRGVKVNVTATEVIS